MHPFVSAAFVAAALVSVPAAAVTYVFPFGGSAGSFASVSVTPAGGPTITANARLYSGAPAMLTNISQLTGSPLVNRTPQAIGVNGGANAQLDTNNANAREAIILSSTRPLSISGLRLSWVDDNDTLKIYGINDDGSLSVLAAGNIGTGLGGLATANVPAGFGNADMNVATLNLLSPLAGYDRFLFTTELGGRSDLGQGYRLASLTAAVVPEPATWAMLIAGFGLVGMSARRRRAGRAIA